MIIIRNDSPFFQSLLAVMNNPELPLDPNLQTSNLLITFLKYSSIIVQDTKGKISLFLYSTLFFFYNLVSFFASCSLPRQHPPNSHGTCDFFFLKVHTHCSLSLLFQWNLLLECC